MAARIRFLVAEFLLWLVAAIGLIAIALVICAYVFNVTIILFRTGSMEPTIPAGSAALVREIPAEEVQVGDALTVEREGQLPVTHRVLTVEPGSHSGERVITMQGDANETPDPYPYTITEGRLVMGSLPGIAPLIHQMGTPYAMGGITVAAALLVGWAFWPRSDVSSSVRESPRKKGSRRTKGNHEAALHRKGQSKDATAHRAKHTTIGVLVAGTVTGIGSAQGAPSAHAGSENVVTEVQSSQYITLTSVYIPATRTEMAFGEISTWDIGIDFHAPSLGQARLGLSAVGDLPLDVDIHSCSEPWSDVPADRIADPTSCPGTYDLIGDQYQATADANIQWVEGFTTATEPWLRLNITLSREGEVPPAGASALRVHVGVQDDELSVSPGEPSDSGGSDHAVREPGASTPESAGEPESPGRSEGTTANPLPMDNEQGYLAHTGGSAMALVVAALGSMLLGRWLASRSHRGHLRVEARTKVMS